METRLLQLSVRLMRPVLSVAGVVAVDADIVDAVDVVDYFRHLWHQGNCSRHKLDSIDHESAHEHWVQGLNDMPLSSQPHCTRKRKRRIEIRNRK